MSVRPLFLIFALLALTAAASIGSRSVTGAEASGTARPVDAPVGQQLPTPADACGVEGFDVPDRGDFFDFYTACLAHDTCYAGGGGPADRLRCDQAFLQNMISSCRTGYTGIRLQKCQALAVVYYLGVRLGGWITF